MVTAQLCLITGFYVCDNCGQLCDRLRKSRRIRLCDDCYDRIVPRVVGTMVAHGSPEQQAMERYWVWYSEMERRLPPHRQPVNTPITRRDELPTSSDEAYPYGTRRKNTHPRRQLSLFGGPFFDLCPICNAKRQVESYVKSAMWLHRGWDDEEWLDLLWTVMPEAFELGVLPGYWFELRRMS